MRTNKILLRQTIADLTHLLVHDLFEGDPCLILPMSAYKARMICTPERPVSAGAAVRMFARTLRHLSKRHIFALYGRMQQNSETCIDSEATFTFRCSFEDSMLYYQIALRITWTQYDNRWHFTSVHFSRMHPKDADVFHLIIRSGTVFMQAGEVTIPLSKLQFIRRFGEEMRFYLTGREKPVVIDGVRILMKDPPGLMPLAGCAVNLSYVDSMHADGIRMANTYWITKLDRHEAAVVKDLLQEYKA